MASRVRFYRILGAICGTVLVTFVLIIGACVMPIAFLVLACCGKLLERINEEWGIT